MAEKGEMEIDYDDPKYTENVETILKFRLYGIGFFILVICFDIIMILENKIFILYKPYTLVFNISGICALILSRIAEKKMFEWYNIHKIKYTDKIKISIIKGFIIIYSIFYFSLIVTILWAFL